MTVINGHRTYVWDRKPISKPGLYSKLGLDVYHSRGICVGPSVSSSGLRTLFSQSPAHFYNEWPGNPNAVERPDKKHFILGRAAHHLFLGEDYFSNLFAAQPLEYPDSKTGEMKPWHYSATFCKDWRAAQNDAGKAVLTPEQVESIRGMADSLSKNSLVKHGILNGLIERSIFFKDKVTGLWVKSRPDAIPTSSVDFVDLKTTPSVLWEDLRRAIAEHGYHQQAALVRRAVREVLDIKNSTHALVFIETVKPHCVRVVTFKSEDLDRGEKQNRECLDVIARCIKSGEWPGPGGTREDAENIELPDWKQKQIDERLEFGIST